MTIAGMDKGDYKVEFWDTYSGKVTGTVNIACKDSKLEIPLPEITGDMALKAISLAVKARPSPAKVYIASRFLKKDVPQFSVGDTVDVAVKIIEEGKTRLQTFEGIVIARAGSGLTETFTVRKVSYGEGVEMVFPLHSPSIDKVEVVKKGDVKRAKLYYLKRKVGKETKVDEKIEHRKVDSPSVPRAETK